MLRKIPKKLFLLQRQKCQRQFSLPCNMLFNVTPNTIKNRIEEMKNKKLLLGFRTFINPSFYGYMSHLLFLEVNHSNPVREKMLYSYIKALPNVTFLVKHIGKCDDRQTEMNCGLRNNALLFIKYG